MLTTRETADRIRMGGVMTTHKFSANSREVNTAGYHERTSAVYDICVPILFVVISKHSRV